MVVAVKIRSSKSGSCTDKWIALFILEASKVQLEIPTNPTSCFPSNSECITFNGL